MTRGRDFAAAEEVVWAPDHLTFALRARANGSHTYHAFELAADERYEQFLDLSARQFGRVDSRLPPMPFDPITEYSLWSDWTLAQQRRAVEVIHALCPETAPAAAPGEPGEAVYAGPGRVVLLSDPAGRFETITRRRRQQLAVRRV